MQIGPYTLVRELARGGMAQIWLAYRVWPDGKRRVVVIKLPRRNAVVDEGILQQFVGESRLSILLEHTNIVSVFDVGVHEGLPYLVMEYVPGADLARLLAATWRTGTTWDVETAVHVMRDVGQGLHYAHKFALAGVPQHIIHRDVSSKNVMVDGTGGVRILDFGVATSLGALTSRLYAKGTLTYMAPEHRLGQPCQASDVFGLGAIFWEMLAGRPFRGGLEGPALAAAVIAGTFGPIGRDLPAVVERVLYGMLHADAKDRISLYEVLRAVEEFPSRRLTLREMIALFFSAESTRTGHSQLHFVASKELTDTLAVARAVGLSTRGAQAPEPVGDVEPVPPDFVPGAVEATGKVDASAVADALDDDAEAEVGRAPVRGTVRLGASVGSSASLPEASASAEPSPPTELVPILGTERVPVRGAAVPGREQTHRTPSPVATPTMTIHTVTESPGSTSAAKAARSQRWLPFMLVAAVVLVGLGGSTWIVWSGVIERVPASEALGHAAEMVAAHTPAAPAADELERVSKPKPAERADEAVVVVPATSVEPSKARAVEEAPVEPPAPATDEAPPRPVEPPTTQPDAHEQRPPAATVSSKPRPPKPAAKVDLVVRRGIIADFAELKVGSGKTQVVPARGSLTVGVAPGTYTLRYRTTPDGPWRSIRYHFFSNMIYAGQIEHTGMVISGKSQAGGKP